MKSELLPVIKFQRDTEAQVSEIRQGINEGHKMVQLPTIFQELIDLPPQEKSDQRLARRSTNHHCCWLGDDVLGSNRGKISSRQRPNGLQKLRKELEVAIPDPASTPVDWLKLE